MHALQTDPDLYPVSYLKGNTLIEGASIAEYMEDVYGFKYSFRWWAVLISFGFVIVLRFIVAIATKYLHFQKR